jgi:hypothetical protein
MNSATDRDRNGGTVDLFASSGPVNEIGDAFGWAFPHGFVPVTRWSSPKAEFFLFEEKPQGRRFVVKAGTNWTARDPEFVFEELLRLGTAVAELEVMVPKPLGWLADPPLVAMEAVSGDQLFNRVIPDRSHQAWAGGLSGILKLVGKCGQVLAAYHAAQPAPADPAVTTAIRSDLRRAAMRGLVSPKLAAGRANDLVWARGFRFSANDFLVAGGRLIVVDPPHLVKFDIVQRDLSAFTFEVQKALRSSGAKREGAALAASIRESFISAYVERSAPRPDPNFDRWALYFYELSRISGMIYNQIQARKPGGALSTLSWALRKRAGLGWRGGRNPN